MNLKEVIRLIRSDYEDLQNIEALRQARAAKLLYLNIPELEKLEGDYKKTNLELIRALIENPQEMGLEDQLDQLEAGFKEARKALLLEKGYDKDPREPRYQCQLCCDRGETEEGMCICFKQTLAKSIFASEYERGQDQLSLSRMDFSIYSHTEGKKDLSQRDNMLAIVQSLQNFVRNFEEKRGMNLLFSGDVSQGKTYLAAALALELIDQGWLVIYQTAPSLIDKLRDLSWRYSEENRDLKNMIYDCDVLILDDLGKETRTEFSEKELFHLINMRYTAGKTTLISTNLKLKELRRDYGDALFSRLMESCYVPDFFGPDLRIG